MSEARKPEGEAGQSRPAGAGTGSRWARVLTTAYCPCDRCCGRWADGTTSLGVVVADHPRGIAADHSLVPPGTEVFVPGYGWAPVDDTGATMRESSLRGIVHLDLRFLDHDEARRWGRRWLWVAVRSPEAAPAH